MLQLARIFQPNMLLQREENVAVWGSAAPGETVTVSIQGRSASAAADDAGKWRVTLAPLEGCHCTQMVVTAGKETVTLEQIAVGEVWIAGGQSNMAFHMRYEKHRAAALADCDNPDIRFYDVPEICFDGQEQCFDYSRMGFWRRADPENLDYFSAVGYYFQKELCAELGVPVGIIGCNWGGTASCAWMDARTVARVGAPWVEDYRRAFRGLDTERYFAYQRVNPARDRGNPFASAYNETIMPRTLSPEEERAYLAAQPPVLPMDQFPPTRIPGCLYTHMVKTIAPYTVRGVLWYQGESDDEAGHGELYEAMLTALIGDWRDAWEEELPFLIVQLPGFQRWLTVPDNRYPVIRQAQEQVCQKVKNTWLCSISDVGQQLDIHPKDKRTVGHRLALLARGMVYGQPILCQAPVPAGVCREGRNITVSFRNGKGLHIAGERLNAMQVLEGDREIPFDACAREGRLVLTLRSAAKGKLCIRFAQESWYTVNLYNEAGIPGIPFAFQNV